MGAYQNTKLNDDHIHQWRICETEIAQETWRDDKNGKDPPNPRIYVT